MLSGTEGVLRSPLHTGPLAMGTAGREPLAEVLEALGRAWADDNPGLIDWHERRFFAMAPTLYREYRATKQPLGAPAGNSTAVTTGEPQGMETAAETPQAWCERYVRRMAAFDVQSLGATARKARGMKPVVFTEIARGVGGQAALLFKGLPSPDNPWTALRRDVDPERLRAWGREWLGDAQRIPDGGDRDKRLRECVTAVLIALALASGPPEQAERQAALLSLLEELPEGGQVALRTLVGSCSRDGLIHKYGEAGAWLYERHHFTAVPFEGWGQGRTPPLLDALDLLDRQRPLSEEAVDWLSGINRNTELAIQSRQQMATVLDGVRADRLVKGWGEELCYFLWTHLPGTSGVAAKFLLRDLLERRWHGPGGKSSLPAARFLRSYEYWLAIDNLLDLSGRQDALSPSEICDCIDVLVEINPLLMFRGQAIDDPVEEGRLLAYIDHQGRLPPGFALALLDAVDATEEPTDGHEETREAFAQRLHGVLHQVQRQPGVLALGDRALYTRMAEIDRLEFDLLKQALAARSQGLGHVQAALSCILLEMRTRFRQTLSSETAWLVAQYRKALEAQTTLIKAARR